jgi:hypothetical protein
MATVILLPTNDGGYKYARIYRADSESGTYALINTINAIDLEYEDADGDYSKYYKVAWYDTTESALIPVQSSVQKVIDIVRTECKLSVSMMSSADIYFLMNQAIVDIKMDLVKFTYGIQIYKLEEEGYYKIPNRWYFDANCGGAVSINKDVTAFKQTIPTYAYTEKTPVEILDMDVDEFYIKINPISTSEILRLCFYHTTREIKYEVLLKLIAYRIASIYFENLASAAITTAASSPFAKVKIGDISVENGSSSSSGTSVSTIVDLANKMKSKYTTIMTQCKIGFTRVN